MKNKMKYEELKNKYNLPDLKEIDFEFEIDKESKFILREIRRKINSKINAYLDILEGIIQPETSSISQMYELNFLSENDKQNALNFYKKLMKISRNSDKIAITLSEEEEAKFINEIYKIWYNIKQEMILIIEKLKKSWEHDIKEETDMRYMG